MATELGLDLIERPISESSSAENIPYISGAITNGCVTIEKCVKKNQKHANAKNGYIQYLAACSATYATFLTGLCWGWMGPLHLIFLGDNPPFNVTISQLSWTAAIAPLASIPSTIVGGLVVDTIGRKNILLFSGLLFQLAWLFVCFAKSILFINIARVIKGLAFGGVLNIVPIYVGEISAAEIRGLFSNFMGLQINIGILFAYCIGSYLPFRTSSIIFAVLPILFLVSFVWMPESPYFFIIKNERQKAIESLRKLRDKNYMVNREVNEIIEFVDHSKHSIENRSFWNLFQVSNNRKALFISLILFSTQQLCGISALLIYAPVMFQHLDYALDPKICNIIFGSVSIVTLFIVGLLVDCIGRRMLIFLSAASTAVGLFIVGFYFYLEHLKISGITNYSLIPTIFLMSFPFTYGIGLNSLPYVYIGELFATEFKAIASCISIVYASLLCFVIVLVYSSVEICYGTHANLFFFAICSLIGSAFIYMYVPETKRQTLADIQITLKVLNK